MLPSRRRNASKQQWQWRTTFDRLSSLLYMSWETEIFNNALFNLGVRYSRFLRPWFNLGIGFGLISMAVSILLMLLQVSNLFAKLGGDQAAHGFIQEQETMTLLVPGINVPWSDFPYMILATAFSVAFHEFGHALAAASEGVCIEHIAIFLAFLVPGAFVALNEERMEQLNPIHALRIYSAGVWQNIFLCCVCYLFLLLLPVLLIPFYLYYECPVVSHIESSSPLAGHLIPGDSILEARGVKLKSLEDWVQLLQLHDLKTSSFLRDDTSQLNKIFEGFPPTPTFYISTEGYCVPQENLTMQGGIMRDPICLNDTLLFLKTSLELYGLNVSQRIFCLKATDFIGQQKCNIEELNCSDKNWSCLLPLLRHGEALIDIKFQHLASECKAADSSCHHNLVYVGQPKDLIYSLELTKYWPRQLYSPFVHSSLFRNFPGMIIRLLTYTFSISAAMVLLNSAPVFYLDGESMVGTWIQIMYRFCNFYSHPNKLKKIIRTSLIMGTILCILFLVSGVTNMVL